uniref:Golgin-45 n=1 Tax=Syphacia muris TaxID=451379 RepID=A0A0N5ANN0_9BILA
MLEALQAERKLSAELKKLLVASMGDDLTCHIQSLSEDKVRLASKMDNHDRAEDLQIMSEMWRCKFLAMSVRADELTAQLEHLPLDAIQYNILSNAKVLLSVDISQFCERTPCDEKIYRPHPVTSNITVSCCKNCAAHEIKLL